MFALRRNHANRAIARIETSAVRRWVMVTECLSGGPYNISGCVPATTDAVAYGCQPRSRSVRCRVPAIRRFAQGILGDPMGKEDTRLPLAAPLLETRLDGLTPHRQGKVRDLFDCGDSLVLVATDRISAFDYVLGSGIPDKGKVLTQLSAFWFSRTQSLVD